jgi:DNA-binding MarR family transcriptional regulator
VTPSKENSAVWTQLFHEIVKGQAPCSFSGAIATCAYDELLPAYHGLQWKQISDGCSCDPIQMFSPSTYWEQPPTVQSLFPTGHSQSGTDIKSILRGHFMERLRMDSGSKCSEREALGLLALRLHRRHLNVLQMIYQHPLLNREEMVDILHLEDDSVQHTLRELVHWGCVNVYRLPCDQRFCLGPHGIRFIAALLQVAPVTITEIYQGRDQRILQHGRYVPRGLIAQIKQLLKATQMGCLHGNRYLTYEGGD